MLDLKIAVALMDALALCEDIVDAKPKDEQALCVMAEIIVAIDGFNDDHPLTTCADCVGGWRYDHGHGVIACGHGSTV